jgi:hypothetical protein
MQLYLRASPSILVVREFLVAFNIYVYILLSYMSQVCGRQGWHVLYLLMTVINIHV